MSIPAVLGEIDKPKNIPNTLDNEQIQKIKEFISNTFSYNITTEEISSITKSKSLPQRKKVELTVAQAIEKFDARYVQLFLGSHYVVWDKKEKSPKELAGLRNFYSDFVVKKSETHGGRMQTVDKPAIDIWFEYTCSRFEKCEFLPGRAVIPEGIFNLWDGWSVAPKKTGSCKLFLDHVFENICNRDQLLFDFLMDWVADIFQHPDRKNGIQVTLYSREQGTGKSFFWEVVAKLLEGYVITLSSSEGLSGGFNGHLGNKMLVVLEEAFWAGDKRAENIVKTLATSDKQTITYKGKDTIEVNSFVRLGYSSNESWSNHVGETDRRNFIIEVKPYHQNDRDYFQAIQEELNNGGYEALMEWLLCREIKANWAKIPATPAKLQNMLRSLSPMKQWIYHELCMDLGTAKSIYKVLPPKDDKDNEMTTVGLFQKCSEFHSTAGSFKSSFHNFSTEFTSLGYHGTKLTSPDAKEARGYVIPLLDEARRKFDRLVGMDIDWENIDSDVSSSDQGMNDYEKGLLDDLNKEVSDEAK